jgi:hypothetical protein
MLLNMNFVRNVPLPAAKRCASPEYAERAEPDALRKSGPESVSTQFGKTTTAPTTITQFVTFVMKVNF